jgi:transposase
MSPLSKDIREKIVSTYEEGNTSVRKVAERFKVSKNTVHKLVKQKRETGDIRPKKASGGKPSQLAGRENEIVAMVEEHHDYTLSEYCELWEEKGGVRLSESTMCRFLGKLKLTLKKKTKRNRKIKEAEVQQARLDYWQTVKVFDPKNLVFIDEMGILMGIMRTMARSLQGTRAYDFEAVYRGKRLNFVGAMSLEEVIAVRLLEKSLNGELFKEFVKEDLLPNLWSGAGVVMDNLRPHKVEGVKEMIEGVGGQVIYLSPYSCEFNPIEHLWWELKSFVRRFAPKNEEAVRKLVELGVSLNSSQYRQNYFAHCGYCVT